MESPPKPKRPRDPHQLAKAIVGKAAGRAPLDESEPEPGPEKNPAAVPLGRLGGKKGGKARAAKLTKEERSEIARKAARARWGKH